MTLHNPGLAAHPDAHPTTFLGELMPDLGGLTNAELDAIAACLGPRWCMVPHQDPGGEVLAVVMAGDDDPALPTWVVHREGELLRLDVCRDETYARQGAYAALPPLLASLRAVLAAGGH